MQRLISVIAVLLIGVALLLVASPTDAPTPVTSAATDSPAPIATSDAIAPAIEPSPAPTAAIHGRDIAGARVIVPRLGIDLPLAWGDIARDVPRDGYSGATPERIALVFPGSALPGAGGNTYIYSHARTGMFLALWSVHEGDLVILRWPDGELQYAVGRVVARVPPTDTSWLDPRGPERLTLQTSTGPHASDPRFLAVATPLPVSP